MSPEITSPETQDTEAENTDQPGLPEGSESFPTGDVPRPGQSGPGPLWGGPAQPGTEPSMEGVGEGGMLKSSYSITKLRISPAQNFEGPFQAS